MCFFLTVPSVESSTNLIVELEQNYTSGLLTITCTPSDLTATIFWQLPDGTPLWEEYPDYQFEPRERNHTVTLLSAPSGIKIFVCGLYNNGNVILLNEQRITVVAVSSKYLFIVCVKTLLIVIILAIWKYSTFWGINFSVSALGLRVLL